MIGLAILIVFAVMLIRIVRQPGVALALLLFFFAGKELVQVSIPFFAENGRFLNFVVFGTLVAIWIYRALRGRAERMLGIPREYGLHLIFFAVAMLSMLWSMDPEVWDHFLGRVPNMLIYALLVPSLIASTRGISEAYQWIAWVGGAMCLVCLFVYPEASGTGRLVLEADTGTGERLVLNPLAIGSMGGFTAIAAALGGFPHKRLVSVLRAVAGAAGLVVVARSSRGDLFATLLAVGLFGLIPASTAKGIGGRRLVAGLVTLAVGAAVLYYGLFLTDYWSRYENLSQDQGTLVREEMIAGVLEYYIDHPGTWLFGSGWFSSYVVAGYYPHNGPVQALGELGLVGAGLWWSSIIFVFARGLRLARLANSTGSRSLDVVRPALALMLCTLISNMKAGDCVDVGLALTLATASQLIRRFRPESEKSLLR
jgi:branched-subunit amino acid transport protein